MRGLGPDVLSVVGPTGVLTVGIYLLQYSVVYSVESLSLIHLVFISRFQFYLLGVMHR